MGTAGLSLTADVGLVSSSHTYNTTHEHLSGLPWNPTSGSRLTAGNSRPRRIWWSPMASKRGRGGQCGDDNWAACSAGSWKGLKHDVSTEDDGGLHQAPVSGSSQQVPTLLQPTSKSCSPEVHRREQEENVRRNRLFCC